MKIELFRSTFLNFNGFIISDSSDAILVDPGFYPHEIERMRSYLTENKLKVVYIYLTHGHGDHIQGWNQFPGAQVIASIQIAQKPPEKQDGILRYVEQTDQKLQIERKEKFQYPKVDIAIPFVQKEIKDITLHHFHCKVFHIVGHTNDLLAMYFEDLNTLFIGDMIIQGVLPYVGYRSEEYLRSLELIDTFARQHKVKTIWSGHNAPVQSPDELEKRINSDRSYLQDLRSKIMKKIQSGWETDQLIEYAIHDGYTWIIPTLHRMNVPRIVGEMSISNSK
jgi:glyoxylase-like metal-dependent hydrolase (beta-lactamase superfamily II)